MWLIETDSFKLVNVTGDPRGLVSRYAILSHTWGSEEVLFEEMADLERARQKSGFQKIQMTCELAREEGLRYAWVDSCCIDKRSSAELSEAINSMFRWYKEAVVCFAYLSDLESISDLSKCRWFTRGWTLQELIAPGNMVFYDKGWQAVGDKASLGPRLSEITGVDLGVLHGRLSLSDVPVGLRMSWAAERRTTRVEDMAYSLLGIFDVNMPLLYGEGLKSFARLQHAILLETEDITIFAWRQEEDDRRLFRGMFAEHPRSFAAARSLLMTSRFYARSPAATRACGWKLL